MTPDLSCLCLFSPRTYIVLRPMYTHTVLFSVNAYLCETFNRGLERALYTKPKTDRVQHQLWEKNIYLSSSNQPSALKKKKNMKSKLHIYSPAITQTGALVISDLPTLFLHPYSDHSVRIPHRLHKMLIRRQGLPSFSLSLSHTC